MSQPDGSEAACSRFEELSLSAAGGTPLSAADRAHLEAHRRSCASCREAERLFGALHHGEGAPAVEPLDDLTAQRWINELVAQVDVTPAAAEVSAAEDPAPAPASTAVPPAGSRRVARWLPLVGSVAAILALGLSLVIYRGGRPATVGTLDGGGKGGATAAYATLLLRSGEVRGRGGELDLGATLAAPEVLQVGAGLAALRLREAVTLRVEPGTRLAVVAAPAEGAAVRLIQGEVLAAVTPGRPGARFLVQTPHGEVRVTGTLFMVRSTPAASHVEVLQGSVRVTAEGHPPVSVRGGQRLRLGDRTPGALSDARRRLLLQRADALALLALDRATGLRVASQPEGAEVQLDGVPLGHTPLAVAVRPGHRRLAVVAPGHAAVREHLLLAERAEVRRDYELRPAAAPTVRQATPGASGQPSGPGGALTPGRPAAARPSVRPGSRPADDGWRTLLSEAQARRAAQDWTGATRAYGALIRRYPRRPEAHTARVSLGFVLLEHLGQPAAALAAFEQYLGAGGGGALGREAAWGRVRALRALGRSDGERRALEAFQRRYPGSVHDSRIRLRLRALTVKAPRQAPPRPKN